MNAIVTYGSRYGTAKRYADWIGAALDAPSVRSSDVKREALAAADVVIHVAAVYAGAFSGLKSLIRNADVLEGTPLSIVTVGLADPDSTENRAYLLERLFAALPDSLQGARVFHLHGAIDYSRLTPLHRFMMAFANRSARDKEPSDRTDEERIIVETYGDVVNFADEESIEPILEHVATLSPVSL